MAEIAAWVFGVALLIEIIGKNVLSAAQLGNVRKKNVYCVMAADGCINQASN